MPPGLFIVLTILAVLFYKRARGYLALVAIIFYMLSCKAVGNFLLTPFEEPYNHVHTPQKVDAMVVLSGGSYGKSANLTLGHNSLKRLLYGIMIAKKENLPIIYSGRGLLKYDESQSAKDTVKELNDYLDIKLQKSDGIENKFSIFYEDKSLNTYENAKFTKAIFLKRGVKEPTIYLVTSAFHMTRSLKLYKYFGFNVIPLATDFMTIKQVHLGDFVPSTMGLQMSYHALHEAVGLLQLKLKLK